MHRCPETTSSEAVFHGLGVSEDEQGHAGNHLHSLLPPLHCQEECYAANGMTIYFQLWCASVVLLHITSVVTQAFAGTHGLTAHA